MTPAPLLPQGLRGWGWGQALGVWGPSGRGHAAPGLPGQHPLPLAPFQRLLGNGRRAGQEPSVLGSPLLFQLTPLVINSQKGRRKKQKQNLSQSPELAVLSPPWDLPCGPASRRPPQRCCPPSCRASRGHGLRGRSRWPLRFRWVRGPVTLRRGLRGGVSTAGPPAGTPSAGARSGLVQWLGY